MAGLAFALPILPGKQEAWRRFCQELLESRSREYEESRRHLGISREVTWFAQTKQGEMAIVYLEANHLEQVFPMLAASDLPFDDWLRQQLVEFHGFEVAKWPHGLAFELIFSWQDSHYSAYKQPALTQKGEYYMSTEENKDIVRQVEEAWNSGNLDDLDDLFAPNFIAHSAVPGLPPGLQGAKLAHMSSVQAMPDRKTTIEDLLAEGEYVVARVRMTGTNQGGFPWLGIAANGNKVDVQWTSLYRFAGGKIVEHRAVMDMLALLQQLGSIPAMA